MPNILRFFDILFSFMGLILLCPVFFLLYLACWLDTGSPLFIQSRLGKEEDNFRLVKFRTMDLDTPTGPSHLVQSKKVTRLGVYLRRFKLDELPQLWNVLKGDMSLVGPRPCLTTQTDVVHERRKLGVLEVRPGITGLSQLTGIDMSSPAKLAASDAQMINTMSIYNYFKILFVTLLGRGHGDGVKFCL